MRLGYDPLFRVLQKDFMERVEKMPPHPDSASWNVDDLVRFTLKSQSIRSPSQKKELFLVEC
jgi:hypothetical protein